MLLKNGPHHNLSIRGFDKNAELQIIFYFKEYLPPDFEIKGYFAV
jgi:hypothetical protein